MALTEDISGFIVGSVRETPKVGVAAGAVIFSGSIVGYNAAGFIDTADNAAIDRPLAIANCGVIGGVADGDEIIQPIWRTTVDLAPGPLTQADAGLTIYASDDNTLTAVSNSKPLGVLIGIVNGKARIRINS